MKIDPLSVSYSNISLTLFGHRFDISGRMFEWYAAVTCFGISLLLVLPGEVSRYGTIKQLHEIGMAEEFMGSVLLFIALVRLFALGVNGHIGVMGPRLRAVGALMGAVVWGQFTISLVYEALSVGKVSIGVVMFFNLAVFDFMAMYRAGLDVRRDW